MKIKIPAKPISCEEAFFTDKKTQEEVKYYKIIFMIDGEVVEVGTTIEDLVKFIKENLMSEGAYTFNFVKNIYGAYKIKLSQE
jgi:hypothetical protein